MKTKPRNVLRGLSGITDVDAAPLLHPLLGHAEKSMRSGTLRVLAKMKNPETAKPLMALIAKEPDRRVKNAAIEALGPCASSSEELQPVLELLDDKDFGRSAQVAMTNIQEPSLAPLLFPYLKSENARLRRDVAKTLGLLAAPEAGAVLLDTIAKDKDRGVVSTATRSLATAADKRHLPRIMAMLKKSESPKSSLAAAAIAIDRVEKFRTLKKFFKKTKRSRESKDEAAPANDRERDSIRSAPK